MEDSSIEPKLEKLINENFICRHLLKSSILDNNTSTMYVPCVYSFDKNKSYFSIKHTIDDNNEFKLYEYHIEYKDLKEVYFTGKDNWYTVKIELKSGIYFVEEFDDYTEVKNLTDTIDQWLTCSGEK